jgi:hypothetical protein
MAGHSVTLNDSAHLEGMVFDDDTMISDGDWKANVVDKGVKDGMERLNLAPEEINEEDEDADMDNAEADIDAPESELEAARIT